MSGQLYELSTGGYCTEQELWRKLESGEWRPCCWDSETGEEWVETDDGELVKLVPVGRERGRHAAALGVEGTDVS